MYVLIYNLQSLSMAVMIAWNEEHYFTMKLSFVCKSSFLLIYIQNQLSHSSFFRVYENKQEVANIGEWNKLSNYLENNVSILLGLHRKCIFVIFQGYLKINKKQQIFVKGTNYPTTWKKMCPCYQVYIESACEKLNSFTNSSLI